MLAQRIHRISTMRLCRLRRHGVAARPQSSAKLAPPLVQHGLHAHGTGRTCCSASARRSSASRSRRTSSRSAASWACAADSSRCALQPRGYGNGCEKTLGKQYCQPLGQLHPLAVCPELFPQEGQQQPPPRLSLPHQPSRSRRGRERHPPLQLLLLAGQRLLEAPQRVAVRGRLALQLLAQPAEALLRGGGGCLGLQTGGCQALGMRMLFRGPKRMPHAASIHNTSTAVNPLLADLHRTPPTCAS